MTSVRNPIDRVPAWLISTAEDQPVDSQLLDKIQACEARFPSSLRELRHLLNSCRGDATYAAASNLANAIVWLAREDLYAAPNAEQRVDLLEYVSEFMPREGQVRFFRRLAKDPAKKVYRAVCQFVRENRIREVAIAGASRAWDQTAWGRWRSDQGLRRHQQGSRVQQQNEVPIISNIGELRQRLQIVSRKQLGWLLMATDTGGGPYTRFAIAKRDGSDRQICAPKWQLRQIQRRILDDILSRFEPHSAAHGFVPGRSTVTNAEPHVGAKVLLKFDLRNFFPTIHWSRVLGLFTSMGYFSGPCRLSCDDSSKNVALALTRLCTFTPDPKNWYRCITPQGAPTSPYIANLICRGLDARLAGLAKRMEGAFTRYADDLTFSFRDGSIDVGRFRWWVDQICHQEGFFVNQKKLRVIRSTRRQRVTGIVVNETLRVPREQRRRFRAILHNCRKHGIDSQRRGHEDFESYLRGFASYVFMVHPEEGRELFEQVETLLAD